MARSHSARKKPDSTPTEAAARSIDAQVPDNTTKEEDRLPPDPKAIFKINNKLRRNLREKPIHGGSISDDIKSVAKELTVAYRLARLDEQVPKSKGMSASDHVRKLFPELARLEEAEAVPPIPRHAPEQWSAARSRGENMFDYLRRVYGAWIGHGFTKADVRRLDFSLYNDLFRPRDEPWPDDLVLPTLAEYNDLILSRLVSGDWGAALHLSDVPMDPKQRRRLAGLLGTRGQRKGRTPKL